MNCASAAVPISPLGGSAPGRARNAQHARGVVVVSAGHLATRQAHRRRMQDLEADAVALPRRRACAVHRLASLRQPLRPRRALARVAGLPRARTTSTGIAPRSEAAPPAWSESGCDSTSRSSLRTPAARSHGRITRSPASVALPKGGPLS